ncbi:unnamed protein product [Sphagnum jensenii]|uniref:Purple acid phosphatase n=1 Tax=Sphagnum jensenii TaxID=128206 RepID=A0ABP0VMG8_9BRYO
MRSLFFLFSIPFFVLFFSFIYSSFSFQFILSSSKLVREDEDVELSHHGLRDPKFSSINRRKLGSCNDSNSYLSLSISTSDPLQDVQNVTVTVSGVLNPSDSDWIAVFSPSTADTNDCPLNKALYYETGDTSSQPLTCLYPVKYQFVSADPQYLSCGNSQCQKEVLDKCLVKTCNGSITFRIINIRTDVVFVLFTGGLDVPCVLETSNALSFANPSSPLYGHLSSLDSTGTSMRLTWVSGDGNPQELYYNGGSSTSTVSTFNQSQVESPAADFGWHDPGYIHTASMTGLVPSTSYSYYYGSSVAGLTANKTFTTPPAAGGSSLRVVMYGDMGKAERDNSDEHYVQPGALGVIDAVSERLSTDKDVDMVIHIGDISYATGFLVEWDSFLEMITPVASAVSYMTAIGNHERDFPGSGSVYKTYDSGGECGVAYESYFQMPTPAADKPWYSIESGPVHFTVMSTENNWTAGSEQYNWIQSDLASVNRSSTPWLIFTGHRPAYSSYQNSIIDDITGTAVDTSFPLAIEPLLLNAKVDLAVWGHVHNYERTCAVYQSKCLGNPTNTSGIDTYNNTVYTAPVHAVIGTAGFTLDPISTEPPAWSLVRIGAFGYTYIQADPTSLLIQFVSNSTTGQIDDSFQFTR